uniref:Uncharacterized protein n=1 Tax=Manihot esculenta TaxID=3983 RepID=A0A2C9VZ97_MANES
MGPTGSTTPENFFDVESRGRGGEGANKLICRLYRCPHMA